MEMVSSSSSSASDDYDHEPLLKKLCVLLSMPQIAQKFEGGHAPQTPLQVIATPPPPKAIKFGYSPGSKYLDE